ncbi:tyrosine-type recombinase/integrase [Yinghuangia aomiensis]|uniref:Tyrosine-type recombinase/integrase n=1 Tax=Yinghuangia aomiensis TaxID=676205 RepID=A0ABP9GTK3_9ACTN
MLRTTPSGNSPVFSPNERAYVKGSTTRRCGCRNPETGQKFGSACPKLGQRGHGRWAVRQELPADAEGNRRQFRRQGFDTGPKAQAVLDHVRALLAIPDADDEEGRRATGDLLERISAEGSELPDLEETTRRFRAGADITRRSTVGEWLDEWIAGKKGSAATLKNYEIDIRKHLKPRIGHVRLDRLRVKHLSEMFQAIADRNEEIVANNLLRRQAVAELEEIPWKGADARSRRKALKARIAAMPPFERVVNPTTRQRIRATLRGALNAAIAQQIITFNPAAHVEMDPAKRPKPVLWTAAHVDRWRATGERPSPVMVWTPEQTGQFLDFVAEDRLYALWHLIAFRGLRRGEACGIRKGDLDMDARTLSVAKQLIVDGWTVVESDPKSDSGIRTIALDAESVSVCRSHLARQSKERLKWGGAWEDTGRLFAKEDGSWLHPGWVSERFEKLVVDSGLPPIRLHDLRHGAATLMLAGGADMKVVQDTLGHATIVLTADTYTSVLPEVARAAAENAARLVPRGRTTPPGHTTGTPAPNNKEAPQSKVIDFGAYPQFSGGTSSF